MNDTPFGTGSSPRGGFGPGGFGPGTFGRPGGPGGFDIWEAFGGLRDAFAPPRPGGRMGRGDVRTAILVSLAEKPMHGYQIIQDIEERSGGAWKPSPGSVYPTLQLLADEGLIVGSDDGDRKVYSLTDEGRAVAAESGEGELPWEARMKRHAEQHTALPKAGAKLAQAIVQVSHSATEEQTQRAVELLDETRRRLFAILAEE